MRCRSISRPLAAAQPPRHALPPRLRVPPVPAQLPSFLARGGEWEARCTAWLHCVLHACAAAQLPSSRACVQGGAS